MDIDHDETVAANHVVHILLAYGCPVSEPIPSSNMIRNLNPHLWPRVQQGICQLNLCLDEDFSIVYFANSFGKVITIE